MNPRTAETLLNELEELSFLGQGLQRAIQILATLAAQVAAHPDPVLKRRILFKGAEVAFHRGDADALEQLVLAARSAEAAGDELELARLRLLIVRGVARRQRIRIARRLLRDLEDDVRMHGLMLAFDLASVACDSGDLRGTLERLVEGLDERLDHERIRVHMQLAECLDRGGDLVAARAQLRAACRLAQRHQDQIVELHVVTLEANLCVHNGLLDDAFSLMGECVRLAQQLGDTLTELSQGMILCAMLIDRGQWVAVEQLATQLEIVAIERSNWLAYVDACISRSTSVLERDDVVGSIDVLLGGAERLKAHRFPPGLNIIKARLAEIQHQVGVESFGVALHQALDRRREGVAD